MSIPAWSRTVNGNGPYQTLTNVFGSVYYWQPFHHCGRGSSSISTLPGGTPWRYPTGFVRNVGVVDIRQPAQAPIGDGRTWEGLPFTNTSDWYYATEMGGVFQGNIPHEGFGSLWWDCTNEALTKAMNKLNSSNIDVGSNIGEMKSTLRTLTGPSERVWLAMHAFKVGNYRRTAELLGLNFRRILNGRIPASLWLAYQYGWKPLVSDAFTAYEQFGNLVVKDKLVSASAGANRQVAGEVDYGGYWKGSYSSDVKAFCRIDAKISIPELVVANSYNLVNPLSVAWELVPFSFCVDWFAPIGNVLAACSARAGLEFLSGSITGIAEGRQSTILYRSSLGHGVANPGSNNCGKFCMKRSPLGGFPVPLPYAKKNPFSSSHITSALALYRALL